MFGHHGVGGHGNDGDALESCLLAHPSGKLETVVGSELNIQQHGVGILILYRRE